MVKPTLDMWIEHGPMALVGTDGDTSGVPNALDNVRAALITLPRYETIREDLERLVERNREIDRVHEVTQIVDDTTLLRRRLPRPPKLDDWRQLSLAQVINKQGLQYGAYHRLKISAVLDELGQIVTRALGLDENSDEYSAIRCFIQAWASRRYPPDGTGTSSQNELLFRYDFSYRLRRIDFIQTRVDLLLRADDKALDLLRALTPDLPAPDDVGWDALTSALAELKRELNDALIRLRVAGRALRRRTSDNPLVEALGDLKLSREELRAVLDGAKSKEESVRRADNALRASPALYSQIDHTAQVVADQLQPALFKTRGTVEGAINTFPRSTRTPALATLPAAWRALRRYFDYYEQYDSVLFPIAYERLGETDRVEVIRISPEDATDIIDEGAGPRRKLGGTELNHFGGFLDEGWRRNDLLWGRLDGAERLITTILPADHPKMNDLLHEAQIEIIKEEFKEARDQDVLDVLLQALLRGVGADEPDARLSDGEAQQRLRAALTDLQDPEAILAFLKSRYEVDRRLDPKATLATAGRAARVTSRMLDGISKSEPVSWLTRWLSRFGLVMWGLVELSTPQRFPHVFWLYWRQLVLLISVAMVAVGLVFNVDAIAHAGWIGVTLTLLAWLMVWALEDVFARAAKPRSLLPPRLPPPNGSPPPQRTRAQRYWHVVRGRALPVLALLGAVLVLLAVIEVWRHVGDDLHDLWEWIWPF
jgi:hypothetical protein